MNNRIPHLNIVLAASAAAIVGYAGFSIYVMGYTTDAALQGDVVGTWKSFAVLAFGFWLGSSSAGKAAPPSQDSATFTVTASGPVDPIIDAAKAVNDAEKNK